MILRSLQLIIALSSVEIAYGSVIYWDGTYYKDNSTPQEQRGKKLFDTIPPHILKPCTMIADIGCGTGGVTRYIADKCPAALVIGLDISPSMVDEAWKGLQENKHYNNLVFKCCAAENLQQEYLSPSFDLVFSTGALHWVQDHAKLFANVSAVLRPKGMFIFNANVKLDSSLLFVKSLQEVRKRPAWFSHFNKFKNFSDEFCGVDLENLDILCKTNKLTITKKLIIREDSPIKPALLKLSKEKLAQWLQGWMVGFSSVAALSSLEQMKFIKEVVEEYAKYVPVEDDLIHHSMLPAVEVHIKKEG